MLDANCINARGTDSAMNQIDKWRADRVVVVLMDETTHAEAARGWSARRSRKAMGHVFSMDVGRSADDEAAWWAIERILFSSGCKNDNERNDVQLVFQAMKHNANLVTRDGASRRQPGGILGNRDELARAVGVRILTPEDAVKKVREKLQIRDERTRYLAGRHGLPLPAWLGKD